MLRRIRIGSGVMKRRQRSVFLRPNFIGLACLHRVPPLLFQEPDRQTWHSGFRYVLQVEPSNAKQQT